MWFTLIVFIILIPLAIAGASMAPWVPTRRRDIERLCEILELQDGEQFLEIGTGDGRVSEAVAKAFPKSKVLGIEIAFPMYIVAKIRKYFYGAKNMKLKLANAFKQDFGNYDVIYVYGMPDKMAKKIVPQFIRQSKPGAKLYSYVFSIPEEYKNQVISHGKEDEAKIHVLEK
ncbi:class I SAM-dependent methyltransferase [Candidatus Gracilibacteria bacterium]|nr:class I SAM-dependent methyltransferase [Candidatus Gracilibacteria bacterium]